MLSVMGRDYFDYFWEVVSKVGALSPLARSVVLAASVDTGTVAMP